jgi:hypothetical protein
VTTNVVSLKLVRLPFDMLRAVSLSNGPSTLLRMVSEAEPKAERSRKTIAPPGGEGRGR